MSSFRTFFFFNCKKKDSIYKRKNSEVVKVLSIKITQDSVVQIRFMMSSRWSDQHHTFRFFLMINFFILTELEFWCSQIISIKWHENVDIFKDLITGVFITLNL